jgi:phospholipase/carboxylesterase
LTDSSSDALAFPGVTLVSGTSRSDTVDRSSSNARRLVIFFHGIGASGTSMTPIGRSWKSALTETRFVTPDAPFRHRSGGRQWFRVDDQVLRPDRIRTARQLFDDLVGKIVKREGFEEQLDRVAFVGVSQGAIMALDAVASGR